MNDKVSVIIPTYNRAELLDEAIRSVLGQSYENLEIIIVDDGSTDNTREVVGSIRDKRIKYIWTDNWGGPARPRNIGIRAAQGNFIAFLDADDYWKEKKLEVQMPHFNDPGIVGVGARSIKVGDVRFHRNRVLNRNVCLDFRKLLTREIAPLSSLLVRSQGLMFEEKEDF